MSIEVQTHRLPHNWRKRLHNVNRTGRVIELLSALDGDPVRMSGHHKRRRVAARLARADRVALEQSAARIGARLSAWVRTRRAGPHGASSVQTDSVMGEV